MLNLAFLILIFVLIWTRIIVHASRVCSETRPGKVAPVVKDDRVAVTYRLLAGLDEVNPVCDLMDAVSIANETRKAELNFWPDRLVLYTKTVDLSDLVGEFEMRLNFINVQGFLQEASPLVAFNESHAGVTLDFQDSDFSFYSDSEETPSLIDEDACRAMIEQLSSNQSVGPFSAPVRIDLTFHKNNDYSKELCPVVFRNSNVSILWLDGVRDDYFVSNVLSFMKFNDSHELLNDGLNSSVDTLKLSKIYKVSLDARLLDPYVFKRTRRLWITGTLTGIDEGTFKSMSSLRSLHIELFNMHQFFHASNNKWMAHLNSDNSNTSLFVLVFSDLNQEYTYPNEDFCLFKHLPRRRGVVPVIDNSSPDDAKTNKKPASKSLKTTCTLEFIYDVFFYYAQINPQSVLLLREAYAIDSIYLPTCNISWILERCEQESTSFTDTDADDTLRLSEWSYYDVTYLLEWIEFVGPVLTLPLVGFAGFVTNLIIIIVLNKKAFAKDFEDKMYSFMHMNALFNCLECMLSLFQMMSLCININSNVFCSQVQTNLAVQYFRIYAIGYCGEVLKTSSIMALLAFSLERFIVTSKSKSPVLLRFTNMSTRACYMYIITVSALTSVSKIFEYHANEGSNTPEASYFPEYFMIMRTQVRVATIWKVLYFFHYVLNDWIFWLVCGFIDFCLIIVIRSNIRVKEKILTRLANKHLQLEQKHMKSKVNQKINRVIIANLIVFSLCRMPELVLMISVYFVDLQGSIFEGTCNKLNMCYLLSDSIQYLYMLSYITNIYFYYRFNLNFEKNLKKLFHFGTSED